jgi:hypothetical protein
MNPGDVLKVSISDVPDSGSPDIGGLKASVTDSTTGQTGFVVASAANGFQNTSMADCSGTPFSFHAEYSTAKKANQVPWAALEGGVLMEQEIGHGESLLVGHSQARLLGHLQRQLLVLGPEPLPDVQRRYRGQRQDGRGPVQPHDGNLPACEDPGQERSRRLPVEQVQRRKAL